MAGKIFISYRRSETAWAARALFERLWREFKGQVFIDIEGLSRGRNFKAAIDKHLADCEVCLVVIGPTWGELIVAHLSDVDEPDWVRMELSRVLARDIPVIPVLVDGGRLPKSKDLPEDLRELKHRHGLELEAKTFDDQMKGLVAEISGILTPDRHDEQLLVSAHKPTLEVGLVSSRNWALQRMRELLDVPLTQQVDANAVIKSRPVWMIDEGTDEYGRWAEIKVGNVLQRLRWIEPGEFWMGSTDAERKQVAAQLRIEQRTRLDDERPRHRVRISQGYWLAETACTQALWRSVVGNNPSHFTGDQNLPVERVSWDDVMQKFVPELQRQLPGVSVVLPTEAQWEYACRAGTETTYAFGDIVNTDQVNFKGTTNENGTSIGQYRERTVPVKALPANAWGLYQMHGNVFEWCADPKRSYASALAIDPHGGQDGDRRAARGGSWSGSASGARSAGRKDYGRSNIDVRLGFRFALRTGT